MVRDYFCTMNEELNNILEKVRLLYLRYGIKSITMDDVARELGISKKTLYNYVADKTELVQKVIELEMNKRQCELDKMCCEGKNAIEELIEVHRFVFKKMKEANPSTEYDLKKYYPEIYQKFNNNRLGKMYERLLENMLKGKKEGIYRTDLNEDLIARLTVLRSNISGIVDFENIENFEILTSPDFFTEAMIYHIHGIANEKGIEILNQNLEKLRNP